MAATAPTTFSEAAQSRIFEILSEGGYMVDKNGKAWYQYQTQSGKLAKTSTPSFAQNYHADVFHDKTHQKLVVTVDQELIKQVLGSTTTNTPTPTSTGGTNSPNTS